MSGIGVLVNPRAGGNRGVGNRVARLGGVLGRHGWVREPASLDELREVVEECRARAADVVGVCGGDGTMARTLSAMVRAYGADALPCVLPLRAGTMNTIARALRCPAWRPERMLAEVVDGYRQGRPLEQTEHQLLRVNGSQFGFMVGAGVPVAFLGAYYAYPRQGSTAALRLLASLVASAAVHGPLIRAVFEPLDGPLWCDEARAPFERFTVIYASTIEDIGLGFRPTYRARERPGHFHVFAGCIGAFELLRCLPAIRRGKPTRSPRVLDVLTRRLAVEFRRPTFYMIDGDIMDATARLAVEAGPIVRVIRR